MTEVFIRATSYEVSVFPDEVRNNVASALDAHTWVVTVADRGDDQWAVIHGMDGRHATILGRDGNWCMEPIPSSRTDEWIASHRFSYEEAIRLARDWAPKISINGRTALEILSAKQAKPAVP